MKTSHELMTAASTWETWWALAWADTKSRYRRTSIGPFWITISTAVMVFAVGLLYAGLFGNNPSEYLPFLAIGMTMWNFIATVVSEGCAVFIASSGYIKSVRLPLPFYVFRVLARNLIVFAHNLPLILVLWLIFRWEVSWHTLLVIPGMIIASIALLGTVLILGIFCARFRDVQPIVAAVMQLLFLMTPIVWMPKTLNRDKLGFVMDGNPFYYLLEIVRGPLLGQSPPPYVWIGAILLALVALLIGGAFYDRFRHRVAYWL